MWLIDKLFGVKGVQKVGKKDEVHTIIHEEREEVEEDWDEVLQDCVVRLDKLERAVVKLYKRQGNGRPPKVLDQETPQDNTVIIAGRPYNISRKT